MIGQQVELILTCDERDKRHNSASDNTEPGSRQREHQRSVLGKHRQAEGGPDKGSKLEPDLGDGSSNGPGSDEPGRPTAYGDANPTNCASRSDQTRLHF